MKFLTETYDDLQLIKEDTDNPEKKNYRIKGVFMESEVQNKNKRIYPKQILEGAVNKFVNEKVKLHRGAGEMGHPQSPVINLDRVSHLVESLEMKGNQCHGVARILPTPMGNIAKILLDEGVKLGVSSRGIGTLSGNRVNNDYVICAVDIVENPSAPNAFVDAILENKEWYINESGDIVEAAVQHLQESVDKKFESKLCLGYMKTFLDEVRKNLKMISRTPISFS